VQLDRIVIQYLMDDSPTVPKPHVESKKGKPRHCVAVGCPYNYMGYEGMNLHLQCPFESGLARLHVRMAGRRRMEGWYLFPFFECFARCHRTNLTMWHLVYGRRQASLKMPPKKKEAPDEGLTRIAIVNKDKCKPKKCRQVCH
jgi:hypothetical protein